MSDEANRILRIYSKTRKVSGKMRAMSNAQDYALSLGDAVAKALNGIDFSALSEEEAAALLNPVMKRAYSDAVRAGASAVNAKIQSAKLGLNALTSQYNAQIAGELAKDFSARELSLEYIRNAIARRLLEGTDDTIRRNAQAHYDMGLTVHIVRKYSDLGLRHGTQYAEPCQWCLSRCGEWTSYSAAYDAGCFERHDGCCCQIDYDVGGTHTTSKDKWNWYNR